MINIAEIRVTNGEIVKFSTDHVADYVKLRKKGGKL
jgi:hypothetical protein